MLFRSNDKSKLKEIVQITKQTDSAYLVKREIPKEYRPEGLYDYDTWKEKFTNEIRANYEDLHNSLLYTNQKQDWIIVEKVFSKINQILKEINE